MDINLLFHMFKTIEIVSLYPYLNWIIIEFSIYGIIVIIKMPPNDGDIKKGGTCVMEKM